MVEINLTVEDCNNRIGWDNEYFLHDKINYEGLNDHEKLCLLVMSFTRNEHSVYRRTVEKLLGWSAYKVRKIRKEINLSDSKWFIDCEVLFDEDGQLSGWGYSIDTNLLNSK